MVVAIVVVACDGHAPVDHHTDAHDAPALGAGVNASEEIAHRVEPRAGAQLPRAIGKIREVGEQGGLPCVGDGRQNEHEEKTLRALAGLMSRS